MNKRNENMNEQEWQWSQLKLTCQYSWIYTMYNNKIEIFETQACIILFYFGLLAFSPAGWLTWKLAQIWSLDDYTYWNSIQLVFNDTFLFSQHFVLRMDDEYNCKHLLYINCRTFASYAV